MKRERINRRTLTQTASALAGAAVAGRFASAAAQDATPAASPVAMEMVDQILSAWPDVSREVAQTVMEKYGPPQEATASFLVWHHNGPWKRTILNRDPVPHDFPMPHPDLLEQAIDYRVPVGRFDDLARYDGSVIVERTKGEISARCDKEGANFLAVNLAHDVATSRRSPDDARAYYAAAMKRFKQSGQMDPYMRGFQFPMPARPTGDPDRAVI